MNATFDSTALLPPDPARHFTEQWGGYLLACNFCTALGFLLLFMQIPRPLIPVTKDEPIRVVLNAEPTPEALQEAPVESTPPPSSAVADQAPALPMQAPKTTTTESESEKETELAMNEKFMPVAGTEAATEVSDSDSTDLGESATIVAMVDATLTHEAKPELDLVEPPAAEQPEPTPEIEPLEAQAVGNSPSEIAKKMEEERLVKEVLSKQPLLKAYNKDVASKGSPEVADKLNEFSLAQSGKKWLTTTNGLREGIIRSLDTSDVPQNVAQEVLERYGIKIMMKMMDGDSGGYNFLNQAKTGNGTYYNRVGKGMYQVFSFGQPAVARMMQLELDELKRRGYDPAKTRVTEVEFGIVQSTRGYDLGVKKIEMLPIEVTPPAGSN